MRKVGIGLFCVALCLTIAFVFPQVGTSGEMVNSESCLVCHNFAVGAGDHTKTGHTIDCGSCHEGGIPTVGNVASSKCIFCHPIGDTGECELVNQHDPDMGGTCLTMGCHDMCAAGETTTTTTMSEASTSTGNPCLSKEIYGEGSEEVALLRYIRDNVLNKTAEGQELIKLYYLWSPVITMAVQNDDELRAEMKELIDGILTLTLE